jgi:hypothetical protein
LAGAFLAAFAAGAGAFFFVGIVFVTRFFVRALSVENH